MNYTQHPVSKRTAEWLESQYPNGRQGNFSVGQLSRKINGRWQYFAYTGGKWVREKPVRDPVPQYTYFIVYGEQFKTPGGIFCVCRIPGKRSWHKKIMPALRRLLKRKGFANIAGDDFYVEGIEEENFNNGNHSTFTYFGGEFRLHRKAKTVV